MTARRRVALVGGHGGLSARYVEVARSLGWRLTHHERSLPRDLGGDLVLLCAGLCSHALRDAARARGGEVVTLNSHSPSAVRRALEERTPADA